MSHKGFIGLGVMGYPMAGHISQGHPVVVYNRSQIKADAWLKDYSGTSVASPKEIGDMCNEVYMCIGNDSDVREVIDGDEGLLKGMSRGGVIIDHTTTSSNLSKEMSNLCLSKGIYYLDAPVSGGQAGAENGALTIMVGGDEEAYKTVLLTMSCYTKFSKLMGPSGSGQLTKMVNQICIAGLVQGLAEGIHFANKAELNIQDVIEVISKGAAQSWQMENRWETMSLGQYEHGFAVDHMRKDLAIAINEAQKNNAKLEVTELVDKFYKDLQDMEGNRWDTSSLLKRLQEYD
jgi:3-hydroxyisobutyrate dehydrogenase-like beta-hydroxyacid dehydrogenase